MDRTRSLAGWRAALFLALSFSAAALHTASAQEATDDTVNGTPTGVNFTAISQADTGIEAETIPNEARYKDVIPLVRGGFSPPDTIGGVGPEHIVEMVNGAYAVYDKSGKELASGALSAFWKDAGIVDAQERPAVFDPVVQYDPASQRWFALAEDNSFRTAGESPEANRILLAVSDNSDPTTGWKAYLAE